MDQCSKVIGLENIYAIGDVARMESAEYPTGHPMLAPVAIQQGRLLAKNLATDIDKKEWVPFRYFDKGAMATIGKY